MYSDNPCILHLAALLSAHGVRHVVLCPGSRNAPIVRTLAALPQYCCTSVTDERSAGFIAIGLALQSRRPAAVCCTSGSALLNLHPAVAEAYYQQVPLIVISADRPAAWIGQMDGQTLPQPGVFGTLVKRTVNLPQVHTDEEERYANRLLNEALSEAGHGAPGPVHINIPLAEPLFRFTATELPAARIIHHIGGSPSYNELAAALRSQADRFPRRLLVCGQMKPDEAAWVRQLLPEGWACLSEPLGNLHGCAGVLTSFDTVLATLSPEELDALQPQWVVTLGGHIVSKRLKTWLRSLSGLSHWHVSPDGACADLFYHLDCAVEHSAVNFLQALRSCNNGIPADKPFIHAWQTACHRITPPSAPFSSLSAVGALIGHLPHGCILHLANSSAIRLAALFNIPRHVSEVHGNRGVNGIEGSLSTTVGFASASDSPNYLFIGDLSFFYDANALWASCLSPNLNIVVLNNGGGAIFHTLPGLPSDDTTRHFVAAAHTASAQAWACSFGFDYRRAGNTDELTQAMDWITASPDRRPRLLEVCTDSNTDTRALNDYYHQLTNKA